MKLNKEQVISSVKKIYISLTDEQAEIVAEQFASFYFDVEELNKINTKDVKPMDSPLEHSEHFLRVDEIEEASKKDVFANSKHFSKKYVEIK